MLNKPHNSTACFRPLLFLTFTILLLVNASFVRAQCPSNLDFEQGDFTGWKCWTGTTAVVGGNNVITLNQVPNPIPGRHTILSATPGNGLDPYGQFPRNCPNGSGYSVQLGDNTVTSGTTRAQGVSYIFTIPPGQNEFSLIYHYAVIVREGTSNHSLAQQARFNIEVTNMTDQTTLGCSSFSFVATSGIPGFFPSPIDNTVKCKDWSAASINLNGNAGKTIEIFFKTSTCTPSGHFGYAYIDINTECSSSFVGATYCPDDAFINVTGPYGYQTYTWWDGAFSTVLGNTQTVNFTPPPPAGSTIAVVVEPYNGYGCRDTLYAELLDTLSIQSNAGRDTLSCNNAPVQIGTAPKPRYLYSWSPTAGLSNPTIANPIASPSNTTSYVVTTTSEGGGCGTTDTVIVKASVIDTTVTINGPISYCYDGTQVTTLSVSVHDSIQWYKNNAAIPGANQSTYTVTQSGTYRVSLFSFTGCSLVGSNYDIDIFPTPKAGFRASASVLCFKDNQFVFTDTSSVSSGILNYSWEMGDGTILTSQDVNYSYLQPGTYTVKLTITTDKGCIDTASYQVSVFPGPPATFTSDINELCFKNNRFVFTNTTSDTLGNIQYRWVMDDGNVFNTRHVTHSYQQPGTYNVWMYITTDIGCKDSTSTIINVNPSPVAGFTLNAADQCFGNNNFVFTDTSHVAPAVVQYIWTMGDGNSYNTASVTHSYLQPGDYHVKMLLLSDKGCNDSAFTAVKVQPYPLADFIVNPACTNLTLPLINKTLNNVNSSLNYIWDFGNSQTSTLRSPNYSYDLPGLYTIKLSVFASNCPQTINTKELKVLIDAPERGIRYSDKEAVMNFAEQLQARSIGNNIIWTPGTNLDSRFVYSPVFKGLNPVLYTIQLKSPTGCITVDTQFVKTRKKIEIYVPTGFTPGGNGINDYLRPTLMGFVKVNYFRIYNRWGKLLYQMQSDRPGWDGRVNGVIQEMQTVVWMIEAEDVDGIIHKRQGTTILIR